MKQTMKEFFDSINGKRIALIGMGRSHLPLIPLFTRYGATVIACDKRDREALGESAAKAEADGALLSLGERYLDGLDVDGISLVDGEEQDEKRKKRCHKAKRRVSIHEDK